MLHATRIALIQMLQALLADEYAMMKKLRDRSNWILRASLPSLMKPWSSSRHATRGHPTPSSICSRLGHISNLTGPRGVAISHRLYPSSRFRPRRVGR